MKYFRKKSSSTAALKILVARVKTTDFTILNVNEAKVQNKHLIKNLNMYPKSTILPQLRSISLFVMKMSFQNLKIYFNILVCDENRPILKQLL